MLYPWIWKLATKLKISCRVNDIFTSKVQSEAFVSTPAPHLIVSPAAGRCYRQTHSLVKANVPSGRRKGKQGHRPVVHGHHVCCKFVTLYVHDMSEKSSKIRLLNLIARYKEHDDKRVLHLVPLLVFIRHTLCRVGGERCIRKQHHVTICTCGTFRWLPQYFLAAAAVKFCYIETTYNTLSYSIGFQHTWYPMDKKL